MSRGIDRPAPRAATQDLLVLAKAEETASWVLERTCRWPKSLRLVLTQRIENHVLDLLESIVVARYQPSGRQARLDAANLVLERTRFLMRVARARNACPVAIHEAMLRRLDEVGRMLHGWRVHLRESAIHTQGNPL